MTGQAVDIGIAYEGFTLSNGLRVVVHEDRSVPLVAVNLWYHVGSKDEQPGLTGLAHLFEHLMFEGSAHVPKGHFDRHLEAAGGSNNGSTSADRTNYWITLPSCAVELALWLESDRMGYFLDALTPEKLELQRDVVRNERRQSYENRPYGLAYETLLAALYPPGHPYHHPVIGSMDDLTRASLEDARSFFRTFYSPGNATLALAGDLDVREARHLAERYFGAFRPGPGVPRPVVPEGGLTAERRVVLEDRVHLPRLYLAWHSAPHFTGRDAALEVLAGILADGRASRLHSRLVHTEQVAQDVSAFQNGGELGGSFMIVVTAKPGVTLAELENRVREELRRLAEDGPDETERLRSVTQIEADLVRALERVGGFGGRADRLNEYLTFTGDAGFAEKDLERVRSAGGEEVRAAASATLLDRPGVVLSVVPSGSTHLAAGGGAL